MSRAFERGCFDSNRGSNS